MEYESIKLDPSIAKETMDRLKDKHKINEFRLNAVVSKCQVGLAKFDLVERMEEDMQKKMMRKIEQEVQMESGYFIHMTKGQKELEDEILLSLVAEIYIMDNE